MPGITPSGAIPTPSQSSTPPPSRTTPYKPPAPGTVGGSNSSSGYVYNPNDPYDLGVLANASVVLGEQRVYTPETDRVVGRAALFDPDMIFTGGLSPSDTVPGANIVNLQGLEDPAGQSYTPPVPTDVVTPASTSMKPATTTMTKYIADWMKLYASPSTRGGFNGVRSELAGAGYYGSSSWATIQNRAAGLHDITAMRNALQDWHTYVLSTSQYSGATPLTFPQWLQAAGGNKKGAALGGTREHLTDPAYLKQQAQNAAETALGQDLTTEQLDNFVSAFHAQQIKNIASLNDPYSTLSKAPAEALQYVEQNNQAAFKAQQRQSYLDTLVNMMGLPSASSRPNETPAPDMLGAAG